MKTLVFIERNESGTEAFRVAKKLGHRVVYVSRNQGKSALKPYEAKWVDESLTTDTNDAKAIIATLETYRKNHSLDGITTFHEFYTEIAANVSRHFGLPGHSPETGRLIRYKDEMRVALRNNNVAVPAFAEVVTWEDTAAAAAVIGYPVVLKPVDGAASRGVSLNATEAELKSHFQKLNQTKVDGRGRQLSSLKLVEAYMSGPKYSVETISVNGVSDVIAITSKVHGPLPYFTELGHTIPAIITAKLESEIHSLAHQALRALGIVNGVSHIEVIATADGPKIVEVGGRLGGDRIGMLVREATGVDLFEAAIKIALSEIPSVKKTQERAAVIRFVVAEPGHVSHIEGIAEARQVLGVREAVVKAQPGDLIAGPETDAGRIGHVIAVAAKPRIAIALAEQALSLISVNTKAALEAC